MQKLHLWLFIGRVIVKSIFFEVFYYEFFNVIVLFCDFI